MKKLMFITCIACSLFSCKETATKEEQPTIVKTVKAIKTPKETTRSYTFISKPYRVTELSFRVSGPVNTFDVQNGQFFRKGELIASIDDRDYIIRQKRTATTLAQAESEYRRISALYKRDNISAASYEKAQADYEKAKTDYDDATNALNDTKIYAPFDGYVQQTHIEKYSDVKASMPVVTFIDLSKVKVEAYITESMATSFQNKEHKGIDVVFNTLPNHIFKPADTFVTQSTANNNISYLLTVIINNNDNSLMGGMTGSLNISYQHSFSSSSSVNETVVIPQTAVCHNPAKGEYVWKIENGNTAKMTPVKTGKLSKGNNIEILSGLLPGDNIAVSKLQKLTDNELITIVE